MFIVSGVWLSFCGAEKSVYQIESIDVRNSELHSEGKLRFWIRFLTLGEFSYLEENFSENGVFHPIALWWMATRV